MEINGNMAGFFQPFCLPDREDLKTDSILKKRVLSSEICPVLGKVRRNNGIKW